MKKIVISGSTGGGKTELARALGEILQIEVIPLDRYFWQPAWREKPKEIRRQIMQMLVKKERWIIEGAYLDTSDIRLNAADAIIFLDIPGLICFWRVLNRYFKHLINRKERRPDLPEGCRDKLGAYYSIKVLGFPFFKRNKLYARLPEFEHENKVFYVFRSKSEVDHFLRSLGQS